MTAYPSQTLTRTTLGQLCAALWDSQSQLVMIHSGIKPGSVVMHLALRCSAFRPLCHSGDDTSRLLLDIRLCKMQDMR
jgi:hypothetical protein